MGDSKIDFDAAAEMQVRFEEAARVAENNPFVKLGRAVERARARRSSSAMEPDRSRSSIAMPTVKESERVTLAEGLAILERHLPSEQAKERLRRAFVKKEVHQEPMFALLYDEAEIDWATGLVKIPKKRERFCPTFRRAEFERYFFEVVMISPITDAEIRYRVLRVCFNLRHDKGGWVPLSDINFSPDPVDPQVVGGVCQQLADIGLILWKPLEGAGGVAFGNAKITGKGVAAFEAEQCADIDIRFPHTAEHNVPAAAALVPKEPPQRFCKETLNQAIRDKVWQHFEHGHYDTAVFEAMKAVEVAVRDAAGFSAADIGTNLMRKAFAVDNGPLTDKSAEQGERQARSDLFAGAIGSYKNPYSHRNVLLDNTDEAAEIIMLANHLLRIVDARSVAIQPPP